MSFSKIKAKLYYSRLVNFAIKLKAEPRGPTAFEFPQLRKAHYMSLLLTAGILGVNFYSGILCSIARDKTFSRNLAQIEAKFGDDHREAFG